LHCFDNERASSILLTTSVAVLWVGLLAGRVISSVSRDQGPAVSHQAGLVQVQPAGQVAQYVLLRPTIKRESAEYCSTRARACFLRTTYAVGIQVWRRDQPALFSRSSFPSRVEGNRTHERGTMKHAQLQLKRRARSV
jgi:hypothetical protein